MKSFRVAVGIGAIATFAVAAGGTNPVPTHVWEWLLMGLFCGAGGLFVGGFVLAWRAIHRTPRAGFIVAALLTIPTIAVLELWRRDHAQVQQFLATVDSVRGRISAEVSRGGTVFFVDYRVQGHDYHLRDRPSRSDVHLTVGDSLWLYYTPNSPYPAHMSRPEVDKRMYASWIAVVWLAGTSGLLGYGAGLAHWVQGPRTREGAT